MKVLVTGTAGFIGFHYALRLLKEGHTVLGVDNINDYYETSLKYDRLAETGIPKEKVSYGVEVQSDLYEKYTFVQLALEDKATVEQYFDSFKPEIVVNLAAQAGVRYSLENPDAYVTSNVNGFLNILQGCRVHKVQHLVYASSSSVYGLNSDAIFKTTHGADHPISLYAATKRSNELMAHTYSHLFGIPTTGLRFFTVYGPWGRPDMALFLFTKAIIDDKPIDVFNNGEMSRDFTYIDDIVDGVTRVTFNAPKPNPEWDASDASPASSSAPYKIYNIGNNSPVKLIDFITELEEAIGKEAIKQMKPLQPGDVVSTYADVSDIMSEQGYHPTVSVKEGIKEFVKWYREYFKV